jgi:hypothetical protein
MIGSQLELATIQARALCISEPHVFCMPDHLPAWNFRIT